MVLFPSYRSYNSLLQYTKCCSYMYVHLYIIWSLFNIFILPPIHPSLLDSSLVRPLIIDFVRFFVYFYLKISTEGIHGCQHVSDCNQCRSVLQFCIIWNRLPQLYTFIICLLQKGRGKEQYKKKNTKITK